MLSLKMFKCVNLRMRHIIFIRDLIGLITFVAFL